MSEKIISQKIEIYIRKNISQIVYKYISQIVGKYISENFISEIDGKLYPKNLYPRSWEIISENKWHPKKSSHPVSSKYGGGPCVCPLCDGGWGHIGCPRLGSPEAVGGVCCVACMPFALRTAVPLSLPQCSFRFGCSAGSEHRLSACITDSLFSTPRQDPKKMAQRTPRACRHGVLKLPFSFFSF